MHLELANGLTVFGALTLLALLSYVFMWQGCPSTTREVGLSARPARPGEELCADPAALAAVAPNQQANPTNYLHTCGSDLYDSTGKKVQITGVNWFGIETETLAPHGLDRRNWKSLLDQVATMGFNTVRLPYTNDILRPDARPKGIDYQLNPDLEGLTPLELLDRIILGARERGLKIVLDRHRPESWGQSPLWHTDRVSEQQWIDDWRTIASRYLGNDAVIGVDLHNEPRDWATWGTGDPRTDWRLAAQRAGNAILEVNPYLLIFVQGVQWSGWDPYWWGGSLRSARKYPVQLAIPGRMVYSPHDYGPEVYPQSWFWDADFPQNLAAIWDEHWGYLKSQGIAPVVVGEFGGRSVGYDREGIWQRALVEYMKKIDVGYLHWALNPDSSDTGGLLSDNWSDVVRDREEVITSYLAPPILGGELRSFGPPSGTIRVHYYNADRVQTPLIRFSLRIENDRPQALVLSEIKLNYWFSVKELPSGQARATANIAGADKGTALAEIIELPTEGDRYLRLTFGGEPGPVPSYGMSGEINVQIEQDNSVGFDQSNDYSYSASPDLRPNERVTLYRDGQLIWGSEPGRKITSVAETPTDSAPTRPRSRPIAKNGIVSENLIAQGIQPVDYRMPRGVTRQVFLTGVDEPSAMVFAPDGRLFYGERRTGRIRIVEAGQLRSTPFYDFAVSGQPQAGLLGLTLDPDFNRNHYVYAFYTEALDLLDGHWLGANRVVRLTDQNGLGVDPTVVVDGLPSDFIGNGGALRFGPDGLLYIGLGSGANPWASHDLRTPAGKILRYEKGVSVTAENPLADESNGFGDIFAWGVSNPFGIAFHPLTGELFVTDSSLAGDEINFVREETDRSARYIGFRQRANAVNSLVTYWPSISLTGIEFYTGNSIPEWSNDLFVMNFRRGELRRLRLAPPSYNRVLVEEKVAEVSGFAIAVGPDGALYFSSIDTIYRLSR